MATLGNVGAADPAALPFREAIAFFRQKVPLPTRRWDDITGAAHDRAFVIAGATRTALLEDFYTALMRHIDGGASLGAFQRSFDGIVAKHGWDYRGGRNWRSQLIFETNVRTAWSAGRVAQASDPNVLKRLPYWQYRHSGAEHYRPQHKSWDKMILPATSPFWKTNTPPNGFGCKCTFFPISERQLRAMGKFRADKEPANAAAGVDKGWDYQPGASWLRSMTPEYKADLTPGLRIPATRAPADLPPPRAQPASKLLPADLSEREYARRFMAEFDTKIDGESYWTDPNGETLPINAKLFQEPDGTWKTMKRGRERFMLLLAETLKDPDEIYAVLEPIIKEGGQYRLKKRYLARWQVEGTDIPAITVFDYGRDGWTGTTAFASDTPGYLETQRVGARLYQRVAPEK